MGRTLEIKDASYTRRFGGDRVTQSDILDITTDNPEATIVSDLARGDHIPSDTFDCVVLTQTLQLIYEVRTAIATVHRILKPGGVLLATIPGITRVDAQQPGIPWHWSFTRDSAERLFRSVFPPSRVTVEVYGNVLAAVAFLHGLAAQELLQEELDARDPAYPVLIAVKAVKEVPAS